VWGEIPHLSILFSIMVKRKYRDLTNNKIVEVTDQFEDIVILDNKNKIRVNQLLDRRMFEEFVDPNSFFRNESLLNSFAQQIKQIPLDDWKNRLPAEDSVYEQNGLSPTTQESAVLPYDPELEKQELMRKAQTMYKNQNTNNLIKKQWEAMKEILDEDDDAPQIRTLDEIQQPPIQNIQQEIKTQIIMDPIIEMFKNVKRNTNFRIEFTVENKIPRIDFIEMMEDSYNTSIIEFLAQEFTDDILRDPDLIKDKIKNKLMDLVYPDVENRKKSDD
jgi:hypothetical protein